jgi:hypothetical protein
MTEDVDRYITRKRHETTHGNHIEMIALAEIFNRPIEVYEYSTGQFTFSPSKSGKVNWVGPKFGPNEKFFMNRAK